MDKTVKLTKIEIFFSFYINYYSIVIRLKMAEITEVVTMKYPVFYKAMDSLDNYGTFMYGTLGLKVINKELQFGRDSKGLTVIQCVLSASSINDDDETEYIITLICERP